MTLYIDSSKGPFVLDNRGKIVKKKRSLNDAEKSQRFILQYTRKENE
jgi:hypothetical protein